METAGDDLGMYYFVPILSSVFNIHYKTVYFLFFIGLIACGFILAAIGFHLLFPSNISFWISTLIYATLAFYTLYILDVYSIVFLCVSLIPLALYFSKSKSPYPFVFYLMFIGLVCGTSNLIRNHSGTGIILLISFAILLYDYKPFKKIAFLAILITFFILPYIHINREIDQRNQVLLTKGFNPRMFEGFNTSHIIWHSIYLGLGYDKQNKYNIKWVDQFGYNTAREMIKEKNMKGVPRINPLSMPKEYELLIQEKFFDVLTKDPGFVLKTWAMKFWHVLKIWVWFFNIGLILLFFQTFLRHEVIPVVLGIIFYLLPGALVYPYPMYILGGLLLSAMALIFMINNTLSRFNV